MSTDDPKLAKKWTEYAALCHAMQSGVAMMQNHPGRTLETTPKHLRVGVNVAMCEASAMGKLLIAKGLITEDEYIDSLLDVMRNEVERYKAIVTEAVGAKPGVIKLDGY
jgi:hypothetical protein